MATCWTSNPSHQIIVFEPFIKHVRPQFYYSSYSFPWRLATPPKSLIISLPTCFLIKVFRTRRYSLLKRWCFSEQRFLLLVETFCQFVFYWPLWEAFYQRLLALAENNECEWCARLHRSRMGEWDVAHWMKWCTYEGCACALSAW